MMFQFLNGRRPLNTSTPADPSGNPALPWEPHVPAQGTRVAQTTGDYIEPRAASAVPSEAATWSVEGACAVFHNAQNTLVATLGLDEETDLGLVAERDRALEQVRLLPARTKEAVLAKKRVLEVVRAWLAFDAPEVAEFSFEILLEAAALLESEPGVACSCHQSEDAAHFSQPTGADRRNPLSWFLRSRGDTPEAPFAN